MNLVLLMTQAREVSTAAVVHQQNQPGTETTLREVLAYQEISTVVVAHHRIIETNRQVVLALKKKRVIIAARQCAQVAIGTTLLAVLALWQFSVKQGTHQQVMNLVLLMTQAREASTAIVVHQQNQPGTETDLREVLSYR